MVYKYGQRVTHGKRNIKKYVIGATAAVLSVGALAAPALAAGSGDGSNASACGAVHGAYADVNGNFGFLGGDGGTPGYHNGVTGQDVGATGYNNSHTNCQG